MTKIWRKASGPLEFTWGQKPAQVIQAEKTGKLPIQIRRKLVKPHPCGESVRERGARLREILWSSWFPYGLASHLISIFTAFNICSEPIQFCSTTDLTLWQLQSKDSNLTNSSKIWCWCSVVKSRLTLCDCSLPGSSVHGILHAILK